MILDRKNHRRQRMVINSITIKENNEVIFFHIVTFTLYLNIKNYHHQVILIDISPGKTKNGLKI